MSKVQRALALAMGNLSPFSWSLGREVTDGRPSLEHLTSNAPRAPRLPRVSTADFGRGAKDSADEPDFLLALSIRQPWVELILRGEKNVENRSWPTKHRGLLLIHASRTFDPMNWQDAGETEHDLDPTSLPFGALVGAVRVTDCTREQHSKWHEEGAWGWYLVEAVRFEKPIPYTGAAALFRVPKRLVQAALESASPGPKERFPVVKERWVTISAGQIDALEPTTVWAGPESGLPKIGETVRLIAKRRGGPVIGSAVVNGVEAFDLNDVKAAILASDPDTEFVDKDDPASPFLYACHLAGRPALSVFDQADGWQAHTAWGIYLSVVKK